MNLTLCFILALILVAIPPSIAANAKRLEYVVALVDSGVLLASELEQFKRIQQFEQPEHALDDEQVLELLIVRQVQINQAKRRGISISDSNFNQRINLLAQQKNMSSNAFLNSLQSFPGGVRGFRNYLYNNMLIEQFQVIEVRQQISVSEEDARSFLLTEVGQQMSQLLYQVSFIALDKSAQSDASSDAIVSIDDQQLNKQVRYLEKEGDFAELAKAIIATHSNAEIRELKPLALRNLPSVFSARIPLMHVGNVVHVSRGDKVYLVKLIRVSSTKPTLREEVRTRQIVLQPSILRNSKQTLVEIQSLAQRISDGESFATLAETYSEDLASAQQGGDMDWGALEIFDPAIAKVVASLNIGDISKPIASNSGFHLVEVLARETRDISEQTELNQIRQFIFQQKLRDELPRLISRIRQAAFVEIRHLQPPTSLEVLK